jgi:hydroxylaminobenzene mutase
MVKDQECDNSFQSRLSHSLLRHGIILFLLGLLTGFFIPVMQNPRMGLSSHLEGVMNGMLLVLLGLIWQKVRLSDVLLKWGYGLSLFGTYTNWATTLLAGLWGAGGELMPIAGGGFQGATWQETLIKIGLVSLSLAMIIVCAFVLWGLRVSASADSRH